MQLSVWTSSCDVFYSVIDNKAIIKSVGLWGFFLKSVPPVCAFMWRVYHNVRCPTPDAEKEKFTLKSSDSIMVLQYS